MIYIFVFFFKTVIFRINICLLGTNSLSRYWLTGEDLNFYKENKPF